jgi:hypothetical protein
MSMIDLPIFGVPRAPGQNVSNVTAGPEGNGAERPSPEGEWQCIAAIGAKCPKACRNDSRMGKSGTQGNFMNS